MSMCHNLPHSHKLLCFLLLSSFLFSGVVPLQGDEVLNLLIKERGIPQRILVLFDTSYSMGVRFPGSGDSYREAGIAALEEFVREVEGVPLEGAPFEWALAVFSNRGSFKLEENFGASPEEILRRVRASGAWNASDISGALGEAVEYLSERGGGLLLLISDLVETEGELFSLPPVNDLNEKGIIALVMPSPLSPNLMFHDQVERWVGRQENLLFYDAEADKPAGTMVAALKADKGDAGGEADREGEAVTAGTVYSRSSPSARGFSLSFFRLHRQAVEPLVGVAVFFIVFLWTFISELSFRRGFRRRGKGPSGFVHLLHYYRAGEKKTPEERVLRFPRNKNKASFSLPGDISCEIRLENGRIFLKSEQAILVDGVGGRSKQIKEGSILRTRNHRFFIGRLETEEIAVKAEKLPLKNAYGYLLFLCASGIFLFLFTQGSILIPGEAEIGRRGQWVAVEVSPPKPVRPYGGERIPKAAPVVRDLRRGGSPEEWEKLPEKGTIDVLFVHAHPDDEAIDFGGLLARLSQRGKKTGVVLFTDGESGLSRGPYRTQTLSPQVFSAIRVEEAAASMTELGCDVYIRFGYKNHPYSSSSHVLSLPQIYRAWGGKSEVLRRTSDLIERIAPEVVVSIDGHSRSLIHFEHEAVGNIVAEALEELERRGSSTVKGFLVAINPLHRMEYPEADPVSVMEAPGPAVRVPRSYQSEALKKHASQIDAGVIALEYMPFFPETWVVKVFWKLEGELEGYF